MRAVRFPCLVARRGWRGFAGRAAPVRVPRHRWRRFGFLGAAASGAMVTAAMWWHQEGVVQAAERGSGVGDVSQAGSVTADEAQRFRVAEALRDTVLMLGLKSGTQPTAPHADTGVSMRANATCWVYDADGPYVVTNAHVARELERQPKDKVMEMDDGRVITQYTLVGIDEISDIAVYRIDDPGVALVAATLAPERKVFSGQTLLAVCCPHGLKNTLSEATVARASRAYGEVADRHKSGLPSWGTPTWIQVNASIGRGSSGGLLLNREGQVVGMLSMGIQNTHVGFAIPIQRCIPVIEQLIAHGRVQRPAFGASAVSLTTLRSQVKQGVASVQRRSFYKKIPESAREGLLIVATRSADSQLQPGDVVLSLDGTSVGSIPELQEALGYGPRTVQTQVLRDGQLLSLHVDLIEATK